MRGKAAAFLLFACSLASLANAQTATVRGFVTDSATGAALQNVNVALFGEDDSLYGSATNADGLYVVAGLAPGFYELRVTLIGYTTVRDTLRLAARDIVTRDVVLAEAEELLREVVVEGDRDVRMTDLEAGLETISPQDIEHLPGPEISGDLALYLSALPGVVVVGDQGGQFYVRGGEPTQNLVLLDGMLIYQPFHILSYYSAFPSEVLSTVDLYAGGFGARFGGRISSVIDVWSRNGNTRQFAGSAWASPFVAGAVLEGPIEKSGRFSFLGSVRQSVLEHVASRYIDHPLPLDFNDVFAKIHGKANRNGRVSVTMLRTEDRGVVGRAPDSLRNDEVRWTNWALGGRYLFLPGSLPVLAEFMVSYSEHTNERGPAERPLRSSTTGRINFESNITHYGSLFTVKWGLFARTLALESELSGLYQDLRLDREWVTEAGLYVAPEFRFANRKVVTPSIRVHNFPSKRQLYLEPRIRAMWDIAGNRLSGAVGLFHQEIVGISDRRDAASTFTAWTAVPMGGVPRAVQAIAGWGREVHAGVDVAVETYWKRLSNLFIAEWTALPRLTTRLQQADGRVFGLDVRVEMRRAGFYGYINYGLSSVEYQAMQSSLRLWFGSDTYRFRPAHDRRHQLNVLATTSLGGIDVSARWQFGSGLPFNRALGFDGFLLMDGTVDVFHTPGDRRVIYERPYNGILPTYHRLDLAAERTFETAAGRITVQASVINAYDRANIFFLDVFTLQRADQLPFIPFVGIKVDVN